MSPGWPEFLSFFAHTVSCIKCVFCPFCRKKPSPWTDEWPHPPRRRLCGGSLPPGRRVLWWGGCGCVKDKAHKIWNSFFLKDPFLVFQDSSAALQLQGRAMRSPRRCIPHQQSCLGYPLPCCDPCDTCYCRFFNAICYCRRVGHACPPRRTWKEQRCLQTQTLAQETSWHWCSCVALRSESNLCGINSKIV